MLGFRGLGPIRYHYFYYYYYYHYHYYYLLLLTTYYFLLLLLLPLAYKPCSGYGQGISIGG